MVDCSLKKITKVGIQWVPELYPDHCEIFGSVSQQNSYKFPNPQV